MPVRQEQSREMMDEEEHFRIIEEPTPALRRRVWSGRWDFGLALVFYVFLAGSTIVLGSALFLIAGFKISALVSEVVLYLAVPYVLSRFVNTGWSSWMRRPHLTAGLWVWMLLALLGLGVLVSNISVAIDKVIPMSEEYKEFFEVYLRAGSVGEFVLVFLIAAVVPGVCEEITFRGLIQEGIRVTYGPRVAIAVSSVMFAVIHLSIWNFPALVLMGLFLGMLKEKTGSIWPGAAAHALNNSMALIVISIAPPSENTWQFEFFPFWANAVAAAAFALGIVLFRRRISVRSHATG